MSRRRRLLDLGRAGDRAFLHLLVNTLVVSVLNFTVWFAITFWVFLETASVLATGMVAGIFLGATALSGVWLGSLVDRHRKVRLMQASVLISLLCYLGALTLYLATPAEVFTHAGAIRLWIFVVVAMLGVIAGNLRGIALQTLVTLLFEPGRRDRANGLVGTATGVSILVTSAISGLLVAAGGMTPVLVLVSSVLVVAAGHLQGVRVPGDVGAGPVADGVRSRGGQVDLRGTLRLVRGVPGLAALIGFSCLNNLIGGAFMALLDAYGLYLVPVQTWGFIWVGLSAGFIVGGLMVARTGLSSRPLRLLLVVNAVLWTVTALFAVRESILLLAAGMLVYMTLAPYAEAAEQTVMQRVVPYERQGRVFGFAQSVEQSASPLTAFLIGPLTQLVFVPFMTTGAGAEQIGPWFGTGPDRGIALVFVLSGLIGLVMTLLALRSRPYRRLSSFYAESPAGAVVVAEG